LKEIAGKNNEDINHVSHEDIMAYVNALCQGTLKGVSLKTRKHVKNCDTCAKKILAIYKDMHLDQPDHFINQIDKEKDKKHPIDLFRKFFPNE
jgi:hypothetical protein